LTAKATFVNKFRYRSVMSDDVANHITAGARIPFRRNHRQGV